MKIDIVPYIPCGHDNGATEYDLAKWTGLTPRAVRIAISKARYKTVILNMQDGRGYFRPAEDRSEDYMISEWVRQEESRLKKHASALHAAREFVKVE